MTTTDELTRLISRDEIEEPMPDMAGVHLGVVVSATVKALRFTIPSYSETLDFGPAPYPRPGDLVTGEAGGHTHTLDPTPENLPPKGTKVTVFFADGDLGRPYVLQLYGWPA